MIIIEMKLAGELDGSVMINLQQISEVEEAVDSARIHMASGNSYVVTLDTFRAAIGSVEGMSYLKFKTEEDEVEAVEGEVVAEAE